tara:strand:+ start:23 stop:781 length:759 start_codon:yes stop_codon:yes gene_type:complete
MHDVTKLSDIHVGLIVKIKTDNEIFEGRIFEIISTSDNRDGIRVALDNGKYGNVIEVLRSPEIIKERIFETESHYSDNKESFYEPVMRYHSIPRAIQSFANAEGGFLYIGVKDDSPPEEKIIGLDEDRQIAVHNNGELSEGKFQDVLRGDIEDVLEKYLKCTKSVVSLLDFNFPEIDGKIILEITIKRSTEPIFFKYLSRNKKERVFPIEIFEGKKTNRKLDYFCYRAGSRKHETETIEEFYAYYNEHFKKI